MFTQILDPVGSVLGSTLVALVPVVVLPVGGGGTPVGFGYP